MYQNLQKIIECLCELKIISVPIQCYIRISFRLYPNYGFPAIPDWAQITVS